MEESIGKFCNSVAKFCNHLQTTCSALKESVDRRPIPLDSASTTFVQSVSRRVSTVANDLNILESLSCGTLSFEELLGHCNEVLKKNNNDLIALQDCLRSSGYVSPIDFEEEDVEEAVENVDLELKYNDSPEEDPLLDDSLSLKNFGISDVCLATIASQTDSGVEMDVDKSHFHPPIKTSAVLIGEKIDELNQFEASRHVLYVSRDDYESLPKHMKNLASWEGLSVAVEKINSCLGAGTRSFSQGEVEQLELGSKARSYLLLLIKMNRLSIETSDGVISYRIL